MRYCSFSNLYKSVMILIKVWTLFEMVDKCTFHLDIAKNHTNLYRRAINIMVAVGTHNSNITLFPLLFFVAVVLISLLKFRTDVNTSFTKSSLCSNILIVT